MKKQLTFLTIAFFSITNVWAQKWVDMGTKADNGAPMYWSSFDLVETKNGTWKLANSDTIIGDVTYWSLEDYDDSPFDIAGNKRYDVASSALGSPFRMPSQRELQRLIDNSYITFHSKKIRNGYTKPYKVNYNDVSWLYGTWQLNTGGFIFKLYINSSQLTWTSLRPGFDAFPHTEYEGSYTIKMDRIQFGYLEFPISLDKKRIYTSKGEAFHNQHDIVRGPQRVPDRWLDYIELQSRTTGKTIIFPIQTYYSDEDLSNNITSYYLSRTNTQVSWWASNKTNNGGIEVLNVTNDGLMLLDKTQGQMYRIRPVYDDGYKNPSKYPNDFGWIRLDVDWFSECGLDIYLDDTLIGSAPYHEELKVKCGWHKVKITGNRIDEIQKEINVSYRQTCNYYPTIVSKYAKITIRSSECDIQIDGKNVGSSSWTGELERGNYKVKVTQACYEPYERTIHVVGGKNETFDITPNRLKKHNLGVSCNVDDYKVLIDGVVVNHSRGTPSYESLEMKTPHTMNIEAPNYVPITFVFSILEDGIVCQNSIGLDSYDGEQSYIARLDSDGIIIQLNKLNNRLYYGNDPKYKQRPDYYGPIMGIDRVRVKGVSMGSETAYFRDYYGKSRFMYSWSLGLALMPGNYEASFWLMNEIPVEYFAGIDVGWQAFRGTGLRVTPQLGTRVCSVLTDPYITLCAKINIAYPINDKCVVGIMPLVGVMEFDPMFLMGDTYYGISLTLGWQKMGQ
jgi:hypothetical protein